MASHVDLNLTWQKEERLLSKADFADVWCEGCCLSLDRPLLPGKIFSLQIFSGQKGNRHNVRDHTHIGQNILTTTMTVLKDIFSNIFWQPGSVVWLSVFEAFHWFCWINHLHGVLDMAIIVVLRVILCFFCIVLLERHAFVVFLFFMVWSVLDVIDGLVRSCHWYFSDILVRRVGRILHISDGSVRSFDPYF